MTSMLKDILRPYKHLIPGLRPQLSWTTSLRALDLKPKTVFDIGVAFGTWELYRLYRDAQWHLVEPMREVLPYMEMAQRFLGERAKLHTVALSNENGKVRFAVRDDLLGSSFMEDQSGTASVMRYVEVETYRFDTLFIDFERPALVKIDVQGAELMVLEGMARAMAYVDAVIVETSTLSTVKHGPEVLDIIQIMAEYDFVLADVMGLLRRPLDGMTAQVDLLFIHKDAKQRQIRLWQ